MPACIQQFVRYQNPDQAALKIVDLEVHGCRVRQLETDLGQGVEGVGEAAAKAVPRGKILQVFDCRNPIGVETEQRRITCSDACRVGRYFSFFLARPPTCQCQGDGLNSFSIDHAARNRSCRRIPVDHEKLLPCFQQLL